MVRALLREVAAVGSPVTESDELRVDHQAGPTETSVGDPPDVLTTALPILIYVTGHQCFMPKQRQHQLLYHS